MLLLVEKNPGRNQTEIASTLGILRPNFVAMLDNLESRDLCARIRSTNDRRSHILVLTDKGKAVLTRAKKLVATKHESRLNELLGQANREALLGMLSKIATSFEARLPSPGLTGRSSIPRRLWFMDRPRRTGFPACAGNDSGVRMRPQSTKITRISFTFVSVGPGCSRSPVASKNVVASLLSR